MVLAAARRPPRPTHLAISPERMPLTHGCRRPPPDIPAPGIEPTTLRFRDLRLARLSEPGILVCVWGCVCQGIGVSFLPGLPVEPVWPHWHPPEGRSPLVVRPTVQARGASLFCPSTSAVCTLGQTLARCPRTTREVGWWLRGFRRASSTALPQRARVCQGIDSNHAQTARFNNPNLPTTTADREFCALPCKGPDGIGPCCPVVSAPESHGQTENVVAGPGDPPPSPPPAPPR